MGSITDPFPPNSEASFGEEEKGRELDDGSTRTVWLLEVKKQFDLAGWIVLANLSQYSIAVLSTMFVGHLGELELSSASVATAFSGVTGFTLLNGLSSGLETLCGQAYGARNYHLLGVYLQAATLVLLTLCVPISILWLHMETVLVFLGQDPEISRMAGVYFIWLTPGLFAIAITQPMFKFMQAQSLVIPMMVCSLATLVVHIPMTYLLINHLGFGFHGGALGVTVSYYTNLGLLLVYVYFANQFEKTWHGLSGEAFGTVTMFLKLAIPSAAMICLEYWAFEILVLLAGLLPNPQLQVSLLSICLTTGSFTYMFPLGLSAAVSTRVSNELGAGRASVAKFAVKVGVGLAVLGATILATTELLVRNQWGRAFSGEDEVVEAVARVIPLVAAATFLDGVQGVLTGVSRGCGWQESGAWVNLASYYVVGLPTAVLLSYYFDYGALGLWLGFYCGLFMQMMLLMFLTVTTDWDKMVENAQIRVNTAIESTLPLLA